MENRQIWANAVLKDGKLIFWWTGDECHSVYDFYKDFFYAKLNMLKEIETGKYTLEKQIVKSFEDDVDFYKQFELCENFKGKKPY